MSVAPAPHSSPAPIAVAGWAVLGIGARRLALPQRDVHRIELAADLEEPTGEQEWEAGWFVHENGLSWPAYSFNESLRLERPASAGRTLCAFVTSEDAVRGILCDHVRSLESDLDLAVESLPGCIDALRSVATGLARYGDGVALVTDARTLVDYLSFPQDPAYGKSK